MKLVYALDEGKTHYITVDLDVWSRRRLEPLAEALRDSTGVHHVGPEGRLHGAHFGVHVFPDDDASRAILVLAALIRGLPAGARRVWDSARRREFNIGIQAAMKPSAFELIVSPRALRAVAALNATVAITVYAPDSATQEDSSTKARPRGRRTRG